ncbi:MAG: PAS domain S-box protein [Bacteroides sp.]|jgi:PAS domain S-box-containing protein|nr:PAS domain S-box protein [Bacteroides sp.]
MSKLKMHQAFKDKAEIFLKKLNGGFGGRDDLGGNLRDFLEEIIAFDFQEKVYDEEHLLRLSAAFEQSANAIFITDTRGNIEYANPRFYQVSGYSAEEVLGQNPRLLKYEHSKINYKELWETISSGKTWRGEFLNRSKSGEFFWEMGTITPVKNKRGKIINYLAIKEDITHRKKAEEDLLHSEQKYRALFDRSYDAILILDSLQIMDCNRNAGLLFQRTCHKLQRSNISELMPVERKNGGDNLEKFRSAIGEVLRGKPQHIDLLMKRGEGIFDAEVSLNRINSGQKTMVQAIIRDVSQKRQAEKELIRARDEAEKARKSQSDFLSLMSHEIRTPLNAVVALTDLMLHEKLNADQLENLHSVKASARHLLGLIDDILDYNKIESGNIEFEEYDFDIRSLVSEVKKTLEIKAQEKNIKLTVGVDEHVPKVLQADTLRLKQVLFNLVSNGTKFTEKGFVSLRVMLGESKKDDHQIVFEVEDTGIGIASDRLDAIFEKFTQAETSTTRKYGGSGLGLTVCKRLIELQGGEIHAKSTPGKGSIFTFYLSMKTGGLYGADLTPENETIGMESLEGMHILMVEDDPMNQFVGRRVIEKKWNAMLTIASSGEQALSLLQKKDFDLVLMDLLLPSIDGYDLTQMIRNNYQGKIRNTDIPIIALTADAFLETRNRAYKAGVDDFLTKPFDFYRLFQKIARYFPSKS